MMEEELKYIIESLLFVSEAPLPLDRLKKVLEIPDTKEIKQALESLSAEYDARGGGFALREVAGGYQIRTRPEYAPWIKRLVQPGAQRLSKAALETLAIVAYKQPVIRADIEFIRGVDCGGVLRMLLEKKLIRVLGRKEIAGRPMIYATTKQFLELFDLKDLKDLPSPKEIEALGEIHIQDTEFTEDTKTGDDQTGENNLEKTQISETGKQELESADEQNLSGEMAGEMAEKMEGSETLSTETENPENNPDNKAPGETSYEKPDIPEAEDDTSGENDSDDDPQK